jgi:hypothetical protein
MQFQKATDDVSYLLTRLSPISALAPAAFLETEDAFWDFPAKLELDNAFPKSELLAPAYNQS